MKYKVLAFLFAWIFGGMACIEIGHWFFAPETMSAVSYVTLAFLSISSLFGAGYTFYRFYREKKELTVQFNSWLNNVLVGSDWASSKDLTVVYTVEHEDKNVVSA